MRVGIANQTTMLSKSLAIAEVRRSMVRRYGDPADEHFRSFDTICSATRSGGTPWSRCWTSRST